MDNISTDDFGPVFAGLLEVQVPFAFDEGLQNTGIHDALSAMNITEAFGHTTVTDESAAKLCLAAVWIFHNYLDRSHDISQNIDSVDGSYWHGIMHRREGDFPNAKYWFRNVGEHPIFEKLDERINDCDRLVENDALSEVLSGGYDPFELVDHCRSVAKAVAAAKSDEDNPENNLKVFCEEVTRLEWWTLFDYCYQKATT